jgi:hypothetical protein
MSMTGCCRATAASNSSTARLSNHGSISASGFRWRPEAFPQVFGQPLRGHGLAP